MLKIGDRIKINKQFARVISTTGTDQMFLARYEDEIPTDRFTGWLSMDQATLIMPEKEPSPASSAN